MTTFNDRATARYLVLALPLFSLASAMHTGCTSDTPQATPGGYGGQPSGSTSGGDGGPASGTTTPKDGDRCTIQSSSCDPDCGESCGTSDACLDLCCRDSTSVGIMCGGMCKEDTCNKAACEASQGKPWSCRQDPGYCTCGAAPSSPATSACEGTCFYSAKFDSCQCFPGVPPAFAGDWKPVPSCTKRPTCTYCDTCK